MDLKARIQRRRRSGEKARLILDYEAVSPIAHVEEPIGRGPLLERLLDYIDPVFDEALPPNAYVWGPAGAGKSAVITALFTQLRAQLSDSHSVIHTATRAQTTSRGETTFVYVNLREAQSDFALYHAILDAALDESVPKKGVGTQSLRSQLTSLLESPTERILVAVDHVDEPATVQFSTVADILEPLTDSLSWVAVGRTDPDDLDEVRPPERIEVPAYQRHTLVDILTGRASGGLAQRAIEHEQTREIAGWADGNAHDALAALFGAADRATVAGQSRVTHGDLTEGMADVPRPCVSLGRVFTLADNRQRVLRSLVELDEAARASVDDATDAIVADPDVDLSGGTVKRFLYELAEAGVIERVRLESPPQGHGRPPSRVELRFPIRVFRRLYDLDAEAE